MGPESRSNVERQTRRKPVPSYIPPLGYDEALLLASADTQAQSWEPADMKSNSLRENSQQAFAKGTNNNATFGVRESEYELVTTDENTGERRLPTQRSRSIFYILQGWWPELVWSLVSILCLVALVTVLSSYDGKPLPNWPAGFTLNTVIAFISTVCRTAFVLPVVEGLSQYKWNWYKSPRPLADFQIFDQASRGPWGSLKLLVTTKGRIVGLMSAIILVSGIATSTLTQSIVTYPTRPIALAQNDSALTLRNEGYFWATANQNAVRDIMFPINQAIPRSLNTPPDEVMPYHQASCQTNNCTWPLFTSLAVCVDMKNVTDLLETDGDPTAPGTNATLPNGVNMQRSNYGYGNMNISTGTSLSYNGTEILEAKLFNFFVLNGPTLRATEIMMHWCVNTYNVTVQNNVPITQKVASYTKPNTGEVFVKSYNRTINGTYLTSPDSPGAQYVADGLGLSEIATSLSKTMEGYYIDLGSYDFDNGVGIYATALSRAKIGINPRNESQKLDDAQFETLKNLTQNIASGLTNALLTTNESGSAWQDERFVEIRWPWLSLLAAQVGLSILTLLIIIIQTAGLDIDIVKGSPLPALLAITPEDKSALLRESQDINVYRKDMELQVPHLRAHGIVGGLERRGEEWVLRNAAR
ncbi:uncharacterized protein CTRU02_210452 [Colletotrichum truncatum]|uniref:Uncharacterized protein n=1 Tax=Colletotrichum truncatum TaxID=5467 RepID=A0ACC3YP19_COLTU|nr:uncharacterized protein CTRU02_13947 [Colletotrichum truncatum]KAF6782790.1 hypothetical protein CTRU02_13947 [Colletotrichum truncatum]